MDFIFIWVKTNKIQDDISAAFTPFVDTSIPEHTKSSICYHGNLGEFLIIFHFCVFVAAVYTEPQHKKHPGVLFFSPVNLFLLFLFQ